MSCRTKILHPRQREQTARFLGRDRSWTNLRDLTCEGEEHPSGTEQVVAALSKREDHAEGAQDHEEEAEDGDGRCGDVVL